MKSRFIIQVLRQDTALSPDGSCRCLRGEVSPRGRNNERSVSCANTDPCCVCPSYRVDRGSGRNDRSHAGAAVSRLQPAKLHVTFREDTSKTKFSLPRKYTLTHSDLSGELFLTIGAEYQKKQISGLYTRLMRDEVLAEWHDDGRGLALHLYCHVSGGLVLGTARWRNDILLEHMGMVIEAFHHGDREAISSHAEMRQAGVFVHFRSSRTEYDRVEDWGPFHSYESQPGS